MAQLQFLGTKAYPRTGQPVHLRLVDGDRQLLVDCGPNIVGTLETLECPPTAISELFVTHSHADHALGVPYFLLARHLARIGALADDSGPVQPLTVRGNEPTIEAVRAITDAVTPGFDDLTEDVEQPVEVTEPGDVFSVGSVEVTTLPAAHAVPTQGLLFEGDRRVVYTSDTGRSTDLIDAVGQADVVVHEAMYLDSEAALAAELGHGTAGEAGRFASDVDADELYLVHLADRYSSAERSQFSAEAGEAFSGTIIVPERFDSIAV